LRRENIWFSRTRFSADSLQQKCTITVTKLTATSVEGTAECPVITEVAGSGTDFLTSVKFSASTD
jgi:hypothetical protein